MSNRIVSGNMFKAIGPATEKDPRPNIKLQWHGMKSWWQLAECRC